MVAPNTALYPAFESDLIPLTDDAVGQGEEFYDKHYAVAVQVPSLFSVCCDIMHTKRGHSLCQDLGSGPVYSSVPWLNASGVGRRPVV